MPLVVESMLQLASLAMSSVNNTDERNAAALAITKAIGYAENGGAPDPNKTRAGKTGELKSIFQYTPETWKAYAKQYLGDENAALTPDSETEVTLRKVGDLLDSGYTAKQIASEWNSGDKNAYTGKFTNGNPSIGINRKYGVRYDVPSYARKVNDYAKKFMTEQPATPQNRTSNDAADQLMTIISSAPKQSETS